MRLVAISSRAIPGIRNGVTRAMANSACHASRSYHAALYSEYGEPGDVIKFKDFDMREPEAREVAVDWLAAPINPSDINQVQGKYPIRPKLPAVPGNEGVGVVRKAGPQVEDLKPGDRVVAARPGQGTWCEAGVYPRDALHAVPSQLQLGNAAALTVNPPTALRMLEEFVDLREGDVVVQNGANSAVGQHVIQIAASRKIKTINVVRDRPNFSELADLLKSMGADVVTTEESLRKDFGAANLPKPKLALNCVGGSASAAVAGLLGENGVVVTYGGMSMKPAFVPTGPLIFKNIQARGFWLSGGSRTLEEVRSDLDRAVQLFLKGVIRTEVQYEDLKDLLGAIGKSKSGLLAVKTVLITPFGREALAKEASG